MQVKINGAPADVQIVLKRNDPQPSDQNLYADGIRATRVTHSRNDEIPVILVLDNEAVVEIEPQIFYAIAPTVIGKAYTPNLYVYNLAFADQQLNYAAALSFMLGLVVFIVSYLVMYASRRQEARG